MALGQSFRGLAAAVVMVASVATIGGCEEKVTDENFERVAVGMSLAEVEGILGTGTREDSGGISISGGGIMSGSDSGSSKQQTYMWDEDGKQIQVVFNNGKVQTKYKMGSW